MNRTFVYLAILAALLPRHAHAQTTGQNEARAVAKPAVMVNLNTATATELQELPGIGAATAARILEYRQKNGPFKKIEELMNVKGIGEKTFLRLKPQIAVTTRPATQNAVQN